MRRWEGGRTAPNCTFYQGGLNPNIFGASHLIICVFPIQTILNTFWWGHRVWYTTVHAIQNLGQNGCQNRRQVWRKPNQPSAGILINFSTIGLVLVSLSEDYGMFHRLGRTICLRQGCRPRGMLSLIGFQQFQSVLIWAHKCQQKWAQLGTDL